MNGCMFLILDSLVDNILKMEFGERMLKKYGWDTGRAFLKMFSMFSPSDVDFFYQIRVLVKIIKG